MKNRAELDALAWQILEEKVPRPDPPPGYPDSPRPSNYVELSELIHDCGDFEYAWSSFLHNFYLHKSASFFELPPPAIFKPQHRAWLGGVGEYLSLRFHLPIPAWTEEPEFLLDQEWDFSEETFVWAGMLVDLSEFRAERRARSHQAFLKRGVIFEPRGLIVL